MMNSSIEMLNEWCKCPIFAEAFMRYLIEEYFEKDKYDEYFIGYDLVVSNHPDLGMEF